MCDKHAEGNSFKSKTYFKLKSFKIAQLKMLYMIKHMHRNLPIVCSDILDYIAACCVQSYFKIVFTDFFFIYSKFYNLNRGLFYISKKSLFYLLMRHLKKSI